MAKQILSILLTLLLLLVIFTPAPQTGAEERKVTPVDISKACNMGFADAVADDDTGGWTDQGPTNDLRGFPIDQKTFASVEFSIVDPAKNSGKSCIMLEGPQRPYFPDKVAVEVEAVGAYIYLLHATAWTPERGTAGEIELRYEGGATETIPAVIRRDVGDWWSPGILKNGKVGWSGETKNDVPVGVYVSQFANPSPKSKIERLVFRSGDAVWGIIGVSLSMEELPMISVRPDRPVRARFSEEQEYEHLTREIPLKGERSLSVEITFGAGELALERASEGQLLDADLEYPQERHEKPVITYNVREGKGVLVIKMEKDDDDWNVWNWGDKRKQRWSVKLTDRIPISFNIKMGASKSDLDFTGLRVKRLDINTGASDTEIRFDTGNPEVMESLDIDVGVARFRANDLGNANFDRLSFKGGVGDYTLDFRGGLKRKASADISMGIGRLAIFIPEGLGTKIKAVETFLTGTSVSGFRKEGRYYKNRNYGRSAGELSIDIDQAIGSLQIESDEE